MAVRGKPSVSKVTDVNTFIEQGGSVPQTGETESEANGQSEIKEKGVKLRIPPDLLNEVDAAVKRRRPSPSRHQWILEAIVEKLEREGQI
ncbi:MAG: hypothetical protein NVSMB66_7720 [Candidatus Doudnabacteria bacterium]